jgi:membrane protease YdiL (CAAX protease family)
MGLLTSVLIIIFGAMFAVSLPLLKQEMAVPMWMSILASFYGGITEEILMRLFLMTLLVWISWKIKKTAEEKPTKVGIWAAIIISSVIFGLGHLPVTAGVTAITPMVVARAILLNGIGGVIFGWLYLKKGLEAAMISHFSCDISIHVMLPLIASLLM